VWNLGHGREAGRVVEARTVHSIAHRMELECIVGQRAKERQQRGGIVLRGVQPLRLYLRSEDHRHARVDVAQAGAGIGGEQRAGFEHAALAILPGAAGAGDGSP